MIICSIVFDWQILNIYCVCIIMVLFDWPLIWLKLHVTIVIEQADTGIYYKDFYEMYVWNMNLTIPWIYSYPHHVFWYFLGFKNLRAKNTPQRECGIKAFSTNKSIESKSGFMEYVRYRIHLFNWSDELYNSLRKSAFWFDWQTY